MKHKQLIVCPYSNFLGERDSEQELQLQATYNEPIVSRRDHRHHRDWSQHDAEGQAPRQDESECSQLGVEANKLEIRPGKSVDAERLA